MKPTFLGIGAQRTGTTRLHKLLASHPDVQMASPTDDRFNKETHFFSGVAKKQDLSWYLKHFDPLPGQPKAPVRGEITPAYAILNRNVVNQIHRLFPDLKLIFVIRNPIDRIWSGMLMELAEWQPEMLKALPETAKLLAMSELPHIVLRTDYERTIRNWTEAFGPSAMHIVKFENQFIHPQETMEGILNHIGADPSKAATEQEDKATQDKVWSSPEFACPDALRSYLAKRWLKRTRRLNKQLDGQLQDWVDEMNVAVQDPPGNRIPRMAFSEIRALRERARRTLWHHLDQRQLTRRLQSFSLSEARGTP